MSYQEHLLPIERIRTPHRTELSVASKIVRGIRGTVLSPLYCGLAYRAGVPGIQFRRACVFLAVRLLVAQNAQVSIADIYRLLFWPLDSVRYFEFDFAWQILAGASFERYLDVSSPRLFPAALLLGRKKVLAELLNPDRCDLEVTARLVSALGLSNRCNLSAALLSDAPFVPETFDLITSISVLEHIQDDQQALEKMWNLLKPGGRLLLTVPCAKRESEEYIDRNEYGLLQSDESGFFFFQRYYDHRRLAQNVFRITGQPNRYRVYGEKEPGNYRRNQEWKFADADYPFWREPYMMSQEYQYFDGLEELPGIGVIGMEFLKK